mgnify:CR=1 FL=1
MICTVETYAIKTLIQQELVSKRGALLSRCMNRLSDTKETSELPGAADWQGFLEASRDQLVSELQTPEPDPWHASGDAEGSKKAPRMQAVCDNGKSFAKTLDAWPQLCEAAATFTP